MQRYSKPREEQNKHVCFFTSAPAKRKTRRRRGHLARPLLRVSHIFRSVTVETPAAVFFHFNPSSPFFLYSSESSAKKSCSNTRDMLINNWELMSDRLNM